MERLPQSTPAFPRASLSSASYRQNLVLPLLESHLKIIIGYKLFVDQFVSLGKIFLRFTHVIQSSLLRIEWLHLPKFMCWSPDATVQGPWGWGFWVVIGVRRGQERGTTQRNLCLYKKRHQRELTLSTHCARKGHGRRARRQPSASSYGALIRTPVPAP